MDVFELRDRLVQDYADYVRSFINIRDARIAETVEQKLAEGVLWPEPLIQLNPFFEPGGSIGDLVRNEQLLHSECERIFAIKDENTGDQIKSLHLYRHQLDAIRAAHTGKSYVLTTGTGSGKSLAYIIPIVDHILRHGSGGGIKAIVVYPMNALANSQFQELDKFINRGYSLVGQGPKKSLASGQPEASHTIFLFDSDCSEAVLDAYTILFIDTFSEQELLEGSFVAVGQVHRPPEPDTNDRRPRHVGHYWSEYDAELAGTDPKPTCFVQYIVAGQTQALKEGETYLAVEKIASGILRLAGMARGGPTYGLGTRSHCQVMRLLGYSSDAREQYLDAVVDFAVRRNVLSKEAWDGHWRETIRSVGQAMVNATLSGDEVSSFLAWRGDTDPHAIPSTTPKSRDNTYRYPQDVPKVHIRVGSVHSVKGETHTAALVLETFWQDKKGRHNLELLLPWLMGTKSGARSAKKHQISRLKLHYVAMTRPTHLLCLAMKRSSLEDERGELDQSLIGELEQHGWHVSVI